MRVRSSLLVGSLLLLTVCGDSQQEEQALSDLRTCDPEPVCGSVAAECYDTQCDFDAAAVCTLEGLRDQTRGLYSRIECEGVCSGAFVFVAGPGEPVQTQSYYVESYGTEQIETLGEIQECELRTDALSFLQTCLDNMDVSCLSESQWLMNCAPAEHPSCH
jgi:hypothetical protein